MKLMLAVSVMFLTIVGCKEKSSIEPVSVAAASDVAASRAPAAPPPVASAAPAVKKSLCSQLDGWTKDLVDSCVEAEQVQPRYRTMNQDANGEGMVRAMELVRISGHLRKETAAKGKALRQRITDLEALDLEPKEVPVRDQLLKGLTLDAVIFERYSEAFHLGAKGFILLDQISEMVAGTLQLSKKLDVDLHKQCAATTASPIGISPTAPSASGPSGTPASETPTPAIVAGSTGMVLIPPGTFTMGSDTGNGSERPARAVTITQPFLVDKLEVTAGDYQHCVSAGSCSPTSIHGPAATADSVETQSDLCTAGDPLKTNYPINCIDRKQAEAYCEFDGKRLPTEAEWEYAARGKSGFKYPWGETVSGCDQAIVGGCQKGTAAVGSRPAGASPFGALDMAGNVWEWVADGWSDNPAGLGTSDPVAPPGNFLGVIRGGSWDFSAPHATTWSRFKFTIGSGHVNTGVRCAKSGGG